MNQAIKSTFLNIAAVIIKQILVTLSAIIFNYLLSCVYIYRY